MDSITKVFQEIAQKLSEKSKTHKESVIDSQLFQESAKYFSDITFDFINSIRIISFYSTRAKNIYDDFLVIRASDDLIQSAIGIQVLVLEGVHNMAKRELRYLIEMSVKYLVVDQELMGKTITEKTSYLSSNIPNSSIEVIERAKTYFEPATELSLKNEITDFFYKSCAYVHPSQRQIGEQLDKYKKGLHIGFESAKELADITKLAFRAYDMILVLILTGFGQSMSGDLFIDNFDHNQKWKFHKGKYVAQFSKLYDYKQERQSRHD